MLNYVSLMINRLYYLKKQFSVNEILHLVKKWQLGMFIDSSESESDLSLYLM